MAESKIVLGTAGKQWKRKVLKEYVFIKTHDLTRLDMAAQIMDRLKICDAEIEEKGAFITTPTGHFKENPALKSERDLKIVFCRIIRELCLDDEEPEGERPPRLNERGGTWQKQKGK